MDTETVTETAPTNGIHAPAAKPKRIRKPKDKTPSPEFKLGANVKWSSQAAGIWKEKVGQIVEVVQPNTSPTKMKGQTGAGRDHKSYVVLAGKELYWPLASKLEDANASAAPKTKAPAKPKKEKTVKAKASKPKAEVKPKAPAKAKAKGEKTAAEKRQAAERTAVFVKALKKRDEPNDKEKKVLQSIRTGTQSTIVDLADKCFGGTKAERYLKVKNALRWLVATKHFKQVGRGTYERIA